MRHLRVGLAVEEVVLLAVLHDLAAFDFIAIGIVELAALLGALLSEELIRQIDLGVDLVVVADADILRFLLLLFLLRQCGLLFADVRLVVLRGVGRDPIAVGTVVALGRMGVCRFRVIFRSIRTRHFRFLRLRSLDGLLVCDDLALGRMVFHIRIKSLTRFCRQSFHCRLRRFFCGFGGSARTLSIDCRCGRTVICRLARCNILQPIDLILRLLDFFRIDFRYLRQVILRLIPHCLRAVQLRGA